MHRRTALWLALSLLVPSWHWLVRSPPARPRVTTVWSRLSRAQSPGQHRTFKSSSYVVRTTSCVLGCLRRPRNLGIWWLLDQ
jgi:hypothetical protein